jgi:N-acyl-L-homoserine lactone synthetase
MNLINKLVAAYLNLALKRYRIYVTTDPKDLKDIYNLRYKVFCKELKFIQETKLENKLEEDKYDRYSTHIIAKYKNNVVGYVRIITQSNNCPIPTEEYVDLKKYIPMGSKYAEISRFIITKEHRKTILSTGIIRELIRYGLENDYDYFVITNSVIHENRYKKLGYYTVTKPYVYPPINDKYLAITMINNLKASKLSLNKTLPVFEELLKKYTRNIEDN